MEYREVLKIDLDLCSELDCISILKDRLNFLDKIKILSKKFILKIELIKKKNYSARIYLNKELKDKKDIIIIQSVLGDDYKRTAITFRDYCLGINNFNRLFDIKRYPNGEFIKAISIDVTDIIL